MIFIGILIAFVSPLVALLLSSIMIFVDKKTNWQWIVLISVIVALPALLFIPDLNMDANSYFSAMDVFKKFTNIKELLSYITSTTTILGEYKSYPVSLFLLYSIAKIDLYSLLPFITVMLSYIAAMLSVSLFFKNKKIYGYIFIQVASLFCIHYLFSMSVVRYYLAVSILLIIVFILIKSDIKLFAFALLIPILIHPGIILPIIIIFFGYCIKRISNKIIISLIISVPVLFGLATALQKMFSNNYIGIQLNKLLRYIGNGEQVTRFITKGTVLIEFSVVLYLLIFILIVNYYRKYLDMVDIRTSRIVIIAYYFAAFTISIAPFNIIFIRYMVIAMILTFSAYSVMINLGDDKINIFIYIDLLLILLVGVVSNLDILKVVFSVNPFKILTMPIWEIIKAIIRY